MNWLGILFVFMVDVIYGYKMVFFILFVFGCFFDWEIVWVMVEVLVFEVMVDGYYVIFLLMFDLVWDLWWGCVMELIGEDLFLNSEFGKVMVDGY